MRLPTVPRRLSTHGFVVKYPSAVIVLGSPRVMEPMRRYMADTDTPGTVNDSRRKPSRAPTPKVYGVRLRNPRSPGRNRNPRLARRSTAPTPPIVGAVVKPLKSPTPPSMLIAPKTAPDAPTASRLATSGTSAHAAVTRPATV